MFQQAAHPGPRHLSLTALSFLLLATSCSEEAKKPPADAANKGCGLPAVEETAKAELVPGEFLLDDPKAEVAQTYMRRTRFIAQLNVEGSVQESFKAYKAALGKSPFDLLQEDNEGFEAELYLQRGSDFGVIQIRESNCEEQSLVILNLPRD